MRDDFLGSVTFGVNRRRCGPLNWYFLGTAGTRSLQSAGAVKQKSLDKRARDR
jgi:hypothetical protein